MFRYWGFGLNIQSEIEFPELLPYNFDNTDIFISIGSVPQELTGEDVIRKVRMSASPTEYLLNVNNIAKYYVSAGRDIIIEPYPDADLPSIRLFLLSNAIAAILHQQNKIPFHASGIITDKGLVLFTGRSGIGKSTTAFGLIQKGYKLFTDDVCVLNYNIENGKVEACASYPVLKLWENTIDMLSADKSKSHKLRPLLPKYGFFQHEAFTTKALPISQIYILKTDNLCQDYICNNLGPVMAFAALQQNTYRRRQVDIMKLREPHFRIISQLTQQAQIKEVLRSNEENIPGFILYIEQLIN